MIAFGDLLVTIHILKGSNWVVVALEEKWLKQINKPYNVQNSKIIMQFDLSMKLTKL
jgi:hypothetical protein